MYTTTLTDSSHIRVASAKYQFDYSIDGSLPNPLEATIAAINACAGVYALKACKGLGISPAGIGLTTTPKKEAHSSWNIFGINGFVTEIQWPAHISDEHKAIIKNAISECAVKDLIKHGSEVAFTLKG